MFLNVALKSCIAFDSYSFACSQSGGNISDCYGFAAEPGRELTCLPNDAHPSKYCGIRPKSIYSGESTLVAVGETFEGEGEAFLEIHPCLS